MPKQTRKPSVIADNLPQASHGLSKNNHQASILNVIRSYVDRT